MLGYIHTADRGVPNAVLAEVAEALMLRRLRVTGLIQTRAPAQGAHPCDMDLRCLPGRPVFPIAQKLGRGSRGCRMDVDALETGVAYVAGQIAVTLFDKAACHGGEFVRKCAVRCNAIDERR